MEEEFYYEEDSPKHVFIKCLIILFIIGLGVGAVLFYKHENTLILKNLKIEVGTELSTDVKDYLRSGEKYAYKYKLYIDNVDTSKVGEYSYKVKYNKNIKTGTINVVDTKKPEVLLDDNVTIGTKEEFNPNIFVLKCTDASLPCTVSLKNKKDSEKIKTPGVYNIDIIISDAAGNTKEETVKLTVSEDEKVSSRMSNDLEYYTNSENDDTMKHILFTELSTAISEDSKEYEKLFLETSTIDFSEYTDKDIYSTKIITAYNKYGYVIGLQVELTYNDGTKELIKE